MKKSLVSICAAFAMVAMISCGGSSNPGIKAAEAFIDNPTPANFEKMADVEGSLSGDDLNEFNEWCLEHTSELTEAGFTLGYTNPDMFY